MPFTGSHPAAVLPLTRLGLPGSALVIGSMAPDLPYFLPLLPEASHTHSLSGVLGVDVLIGLVCLALWYALIAPLAVALAPAALRSRLPTLPAAGHRPGAVTVLLAAVAVMIGAATHVLWDEFTHHDRFGTRHVGWLAAQQGALPGYRWAQYGSGVFGALVIAGATWHWWRSRTPSPGSAASRLAPRTVVTVRTAILSATAAGAAAGCLAAAAGDLGPRRGVFLAATWGGGAGLVVLGLCALALASTLRISTEPVRPGPY